MNRQLAAWLLIATLLSYSIIMALVPLVVDEEQVTPQPSEQTQQTDNPLQVKQGSGEPAPLEGFNLQGSQSTQEAAGNLQQPQSVDDLQPNARTDLFSDDL